MPWYPVSHRIEVRVDRIKEIKLTAFIDSREARRTKEENTCFWQTLKCGIRCMQRKGSRVQ